MDNTTILLSVVIFTAGILLAAWMNREANILQHSGSVKSKIADKRHEIYSEIIAYIETWHGDKADCPFALKCNAVNEHPLELGIFVHKITNAEKLEEELVRIVGLTKYHPYLNNLTYSNLKCLESYLLKVKQYVDEEGYPDNLFFSYIIYRDIHYFVAEVQKSVQLYLRHPNSLSWKFKHTVKGNEFRRKFEKSHFYNVYELERIVNQKNKKEANKINKKRKKSHGYRLSRQCKECSEQCVLSIPRDSEMEKYGFEEINQMVEEPQHVSQTFETTEDGSSDHIPS